MKKNIHPKSEISTFKCATCSTEYKLYSTKKSGVVSLDVCANCHPFISGKASEQVSKGRSEKFSGKFNTGKTAPNKKTVFEPKSLKKDSKKTITTLENLKA